MVSPVHVIAQLNWLRGLQSWITMWSSFGCCREKLGMRCAVGGKSEMM